MNKENDKNVGKYKQILYKIVMSHFLGEEEQIQLKHCTLACKLEGAIGIKMCLSICRRCKYKNKQGKGKKERKVRIK